MTSFLSSLAGWKTYIMIAVTTLDAIGAQLGWWQADTVRQMIEGALGAAALRSGVAASGPVVK